MSLHKELQALIHSIVPSTDMAGVFMTRDQIIQLIDKVAHEASLLGWVHAETLSRRRLENNIQKLEQEIEILKAQLKTTELELLASSK